MKKKIIFGIISVVLYLIYIFIFTRHSILGNLIVAIIVFVVGMTIMTAFDIITNKIEKRSK